MKGRHLSPETMHAFLDGILSPGDARRAEEHLASCSACSDEVTILRTVFDTLTALPDEPIAVDLRPAVVARLQPPATRFPRLRWVVTAQAAGIALGLAVSWRWLAEILRPLGGLARQIWLTADTQLLAEAAEWTGDAVSQPIARAVDLLAGARLSLPQPNVPLAQGLTLVLSAVALWLVGHRLLLRAGQAPGGLEEAPR